MTTFLRRIPVLVLGVLLVAAPPFVPDRLEAAETAPYASAWDGAAFDAAVAAGGPVLVEVSAPWCPVCRQQQAILTDLLADPRFDGLAVFEVDFDSDKDVLRRLDARSQSTLIVYAGGAEIDRSVGDTSRDGIERLVAAGLAAAR